MLVASLNSSVASHCLASSTDEENSSSLNASIYSLDGFDVIQPDIPTYKNINKRQDTSGNTWLHFAMSKANSLEEIQELFDLGAEPSLKNDRGETPLHLISRECDPAIIQLFIEKGANFDHQDKLGNTPLHYVVFNGSSLKLIEKFIEGTTDFLIEGTTNLFLANTKKKLTALQLAIQLKRPSDIILALQLQGKTPDPNNETHQSPLHFALANNESWESIQALSYLIQDINKQYSKGESLLHFALRQKKPSLEIIQTLIDLEANPSLTNKVGQTAIQLALKSKCCSYIILALLIKEQNNRDNSLLIKGENKPTKPLAPSRLRDWDNEWMKRLGSPWDSLKANFTPSKFYRERFDDMRSPQHFVIKKKWDSTYIKALLGIVENINKRYTGGDTLLHFAMGQENGSAEVIRLLFEAGAGAYLRNNHEQTPLHFISKHCDVETIQLFIKEIRKLADLQIFDILMPYDKTLKKSQDADTQFMQIFLNHQDYLGNTALHYYLMEPVGKLDTLSELLQAGADPDVANNAKQSPLQFAIQQQLRPDIILALQLEGKNPDPNNEAHQSPLHFALANKQSTPEDIEALLYIVNANKSLDKSVSAINEGELSEGFTLVENATGITSINDKYRGKTLLYFAYKNRCSKEILQVLINNGAHVGDTSEHIIGKVPTSPIAERFKENRIPINYQNADGNTLFHIAIESGNYRLETIQQFLSLGADPYLPNKAGRSPLQLIWENAAPHTVEQLLKDGRVDINYQNAKGNTLFHAVIESGNCRLKTIQKFLSLRANPHLLNEAMQSPLQLILEKCDPHTVEQLLKSGKVNNDRVNINHQDAQGNTLLHTAIQSGNYRLETIQKFLDLGADPYLPNKAGWSPLQLILEKCDPHTIEQLLTDDRVDINHQDAQGNTLFHIAIESGNYRLETIQQFLNLRANPYLPNKAGWSPLQLIWEKAAPHTVKQLLTDDRVDINHKDKLGNTLFHAAIQSGNCRLKTIQKFLGLGADLYLLNEAMQSPLQLILEKCDPHTAEQLLKSGKVNNDRVNINHQDAQGNTLLHTAIQSGNSGLKMLQKFLRFAANPYLVNGAIQSAIQLAIQLKRPSDIILALQLQGKTPDPNNETHQSPLHFALANEKFTSEDVKGLLYTINEKDINQKFLRENTLLQFALKNASSISKIQALFGKESIDFKFSFKNWLLLRKIIKDKKQDKIEAKTQKDLVENLSKKMKAGRFFVMNWFIKLCIGCAYL